MKTNWPALRSGFLILASAAAAMSPALAQAQEPAGAITTPSVISSVAVMQASLRASVRLEGEGRLDAHAARMQNPERLVLDFSKTRLAVKKTTIAGVSAPVVDVRLGQYRPDVTRVVIDLSSAAPYQISRDGNAVVVFFDAQPEASSGNADITSQQITKTRGEFHYNAAAPRTVAFRSMKNAPISSPRFALPNELAQPSFVLAAFNGKSEPARPDETTPAAKQAAQQANTAATTMATSSGQVASVVAQPGKYTGEPISVNLKDVDLRDFFRLIHEISGLNVVLDPAVKGSLTIVLDEVPWDQALDIVLQNNGLDKQLNGNVLRIATRDTLKKEAETQRDLEKAQAEAVAPVTVTRVLSYAKAASMTTTLKKFLSARGDILSDDRSNQLIIRDIPSVIPVVDNLIRQLDRKSQQVEIEARVVSASRAFAQDIGTQLGFAGSATNGRSLFSGLPSVGGSGAVVGAPAPPSPVVMATGVPSGNGIASGIPLLTNLVAGVPTSGVGFSHRSPNFAIDFFITAAESKGVGKLLSKPKVITQNNEKATVKQGTKIPIQTTINNTISVQFIDAVLKLEVTPQITAEGTVFMDVLVENTTIDAGIPRVQGIPALNTQSAETKVLVADGGTVVIGGIIISSQRRDVTEVPLVGSLPIIGHLFKRTNVTVQSQELLFFLTPRIIPG
ncbi:MAG TPA: type IV pilus secretin PilQ [Candidatus Dormibacteraeota bacterium]|nr:type IV pilus secretin PilQ [Candidatus Dormibacteraeota bacterium]